MKSAQKKKKPLRWGLICLVLCILTVVSFNGIATLSKYVLSLSTYRQADAKAFYFTSDLLAAGDTPVFQIANFIPGTSTISFNLRNYSDELHVSESAVAYTITTDNPNVTGAPGTVALNGTSPVNQPVSLSVPSTAFTSDKVTIRVTAVSTAPYSTTWSAVFELYRKTVDADFSVYDAIDNNTVTLTITTGDDSGTVNIGFPATLYPDRTDGRLTAVGTTVCSFSAAANAQYSFVFFKSDPSSVYSVTAFSVG